MESDGIQWNDLEGPVEYLEKSLYEPRVILLSTMEGE